VKAGLNAFAGVVRLPGVSQLGGAGASSQVGWEGPVGSDAAWGERLLIPHAPRRGVSLVCLENQAEGKAAAVSEGMI